MDLKNIGVLNSASVSVLHVTREWLDDGRYGLGKSLDPLFKGLQELGHHSDRISQVDLSSQSLRFREKVLEFLSQVPGLSRGSHRHLLVVAFLERMQVAHLAVQKARKENYSCIHAHDPWIGGFIGLGLLFVPGNRMRWGITEHGFGAYFRAVQLDGLFLTPLMEVLLQRFERFVLKRAHFVVCPTRSSLQNLILDLDIASSPPSNWHVIPHRLRVPSLPDRGDAREKLGWAEGERIIIAVGRLVPLKRFDLLLESFVRIRQCLSNVRLVFLGDGPDLGKLRTLASLPELGKSVEFHTTEDVWPYLSAADLYVSPSLSESFGLANFEALLLGLPCVCSPAGAVTEVMGDAAEYLLDDLSNLDKLLISLLSEPGRLENVRHRAQRRARQVSSVNEMVEHYVAIYSSGCEI